MATVTPETIASITPSPVTYKTVPAPRAKRMRPLLTAVDIGQGYVMYGNCACKWDDAACAARCGGAQPTSAPPSLGNIGSAAATGDYRTGIQSTSMYSPQTSYTDSFGAWVLPLSPEEFWWS